MEISNINNKVGSIMLDPEVGIGLARMVKGDNISFHVALVENRIKLHYHRYRDEVYYIVKGKGLIRVGEEKRDVREGDVVLIPKGEPHSLENKGKEPLVLVFASAPPFAPEEDREMLE